MSRGIIADRVSDLGTIFARFVLDGNQPRHTADDDGLKHYWIDLCFEPKPGARVESVIFVLDEDTYEDPIRLADARTGFRARISSYGDFAVTAKIETDSEFRSRSDILSDLLRRGHQSDAVPSPAVTSAIKDIEDN